MRRAEKEYRKLTGRQARGQSGRMALLRKMTMDEMLEAANALDTIEKGRAVQFQGMSKNAQKYIARANVRKQNVKARAEILERAIVHKNKTVNKPTDEARKTYEKLFAKVQA